MGLDLEFLKNNDHVLRSHSFTVSIKMERVVMIAYVFLSQNLHHYFNRHVCLSMCPSVFPFFRHNFFLLKLPWNHLLTPGVAPGSARAMPAKWAFSSY